MKAWCIKSPRNILLLNTVARLKGQAIEKQCDPFSGDEQGARWGHWYYFGYRAVKIEIKEQSK